MELNLKKPIVFFDLEATGTNVAKDRIVEISMVKVHPGAKEESKTFRVNPTIPIEPGATKVHGIKDEDVKDWPTFNEIAREVADFMKNCDLAGYNSNKFDIPMIAEEFLRAEIDFDFKKIKFVDVQVVFFKKEQRTLSAAYKFYCKKDLESAHSAEADTMATYEVLKSQLDRYDDLKNDIDFLSKFTVQTRNADFAGRIVFNDKGEEVFNFGKYRGVKVEDVLAKDSGYYNWMMNGDFPLYTKKVLTGIKLRNAFGK